MGRIQGGTSEDFDALSFQTTLEKQDLSPTRIIAQKIRGFDPEKIFSHPFQKTTSEKTNQTLAQKALTQEKLKQTLEKIQFLQESARDIKYREGLITRSKTSTEAGIKEFQAQITHLRTLLEKPKKIYAQVKDNFSKKKLERCNAALKKKNIPGQSTQPIPDQLLSRSELKHKIHVLELRKNGYEETIERSEKILFEIDQELKTLSVETPEHGTVYLHEIEVLEQFASSLQQSLERLENENACLESEHEVPFNSDSEMQISLEQFQAVINQLLVELRQLSRAD